MTGQRRWALLVGFWSLPAIAIAGQLYVQLQAAGRAPSWWSLLLIQLLRWWPWALLTPWIQRVARNNPLRRGRLGRPLAALALTGAALALLMAAWAVFIDLRLFQGIRMDAATWVVRIARSAVINLPTFLAAYGGILTVTYLSDMYTEYQRRQTEAERLRSDLAEARLQALQLQLQPHFLFNTLHTIAALMDEDVERAQRMTARLGALLRATLELSDDPLVPVEQEIRLAELYLDIERARFEDRLQVEWQIDPESLGVQVPTLTLQPLVENAVRHGVGARSEAGRLLVRIARQQGELTIEVHDDGAGPPASPRFGTGLSSIRDRLEQCYGEGASIRLAPRDGGGCIATVAIPLQP